MYNNGDLKRKDNTLQFTAYDGEKRDIPIERISDIYVMSEMSFNTTFLNYISQYGIAVGLLTGYFMMVVVFRIYSGMEGVLYTPVITAQSIILTIVIVIACYAVSLLTVRRKADRVDMVESLKDNRE